MTFSLAGRCERTGAVGAVIASASMAVAARCVAVRAGVGAVCSQSTTDPRLRGALLEAMAGGLAASAALAAVVGRAPDIAYRQLATVDAAGGSGSYSGADCHASRRHRHARRGDHGTDRPGAFTAAHPRERHGFTATTVTSTSHSGRASADTTRPVNTG